MSSSSIKKSRLIDLLWEICGGEATFFIDVSSPRNGLRVPMRGVQKEVIHAAHNPQL